MKYVLGNLEVRIDNLEAGDVFTTEQLKEKVYADIAEYKGVKIRLMNIESGSVDDFENAEDFLHSDFELDDKAIALKIVNINMGYIYYEVTEDLGYSAYTLILAVKNYI